MESQQNRQLDTDPRTDPLRDADSHVAVGTPVPDDPELLLGDTETARGVLGLSQEPAEPAEPEPQEAGPVERLGAVAARAGAAVVAGLRHAAARPMAFAPGRAHDATREYGGPDADPSRTRPPYLMVAGLAAGALAAVLVLRRRRG
ncbi:hypothetical protein OG823_04325 [Kitasatospora sp. NBC_00315]